MHLKFSAFKLRLIIGVTTGCAAGTLIGATEGASSAKIGAGFYAAVLNAGLFAPMAALISLISIFSVALLFSKSPVKYLAQYAQHLKDNPADAAKFAARSMFLQLGILLFLIFIFHISRSFLIAFHHMGLASLLLTVLILGAGLIALLFINAATRWTTPKLLSHVKHWLLVKLCLASLFILPVLLGLMLIFSPVDGMGILGFLGLLKRDELELAFLLPAIVSIVISVVTFSLPLSKKIVPFYVLFFLIATGGFSATVVAATNFDSNLNASLTVERDAATGRRILFVYRAIFDRDKDGSASLFGGGDCDDSNPNLWPGAIDIPGNGVDEDCSGSDATKQPPKIIKQKNLTPKITIPDNLSVVLLTIDALRWDIVWGGNTRPLTPNIDALAKQAVTFKNAYALSSFTGRSIGPIFVGRYPSEVYCNADHLGIYYPKNQMLAETLQALDIKTASVQGHPYFKRSGLNQGFDNWDVIIPPGDEAWDQKITTPDVAKKLIEYINDDNFTGGRFFLWSHLMAPHKAYLKHKGFSNFGDSRRDLYDGEVAFVDYYIGKIIDALKAKKLFERTVIIISSDHGEAFMEHDICFHGRRLWEEVVKVPWIWVIPAVAPKVVKARVSHVDMAKTIYQLLKITPPAQTGGQSLLPLMTGDETGDRRIFIDQPSGRYMPEMHAVIDNNYKLIHSVNGNRYQLFNLKTDPGEKTDLSTTDPNKLKQLKQVYQNLRSNLQLNADKYKP